MSTVAEEEEVDAEEPWYIPVIRNVPYCGDGMANIMWDDDS